MSVFLVRFVMSLFVEACLINLFFDWLRARMMISLVKWKENVSKKLLGKVPLWSYVYIEPEHVKRSVQLKTLSQVSLLCFSSGYLAMRSLLFKFFIIVFSGYAFHISLKTFFTQVIYRYHKCIFDLMNSTKMVVKEKLYSTNQLYMWN